LCFTSQCEIPINKKYLSPERHSFAKKDNRDGIRRIFHYKSSAGKLTAFTGTCCLWITQIIIPVVFAFVNTFLKKVKN